MSRSYSIIGAHMSGVRIAGELSFTPAHVDRDGYLINDRISVPVIANNRRGKRDNFRLTAWAGYARGLCKYGSVGKCIDIEVKPGSYDGTVYKMAPNPQNPAEQIPQPVIVAGQPLVTTKVGFTITDMSYGEESAKQIQRELEIYASNPASIAGRPPQWNVMGSPDQAKFGQILDARKSMAWDCQSPYFGYARIVQPRNAQRLLNTQERVVLETHGVRALNIPLASDKRAAAGTPVATTGFATGTPAAAPADVANAFVQSPAVQPAPGQAPMVNPFLRPAAEPAQVGQMVTPATQQSAF